MIEAAESLVPLHNAPALARIERHARTSPTSRMSPSSTQRSMPLCPRKRPCTRFRDSGARSGECAACRPCARGARGRALLAGAARSLDPKQRCDGEHRHSAEARPGRDGEIPPRCDCLWQQFDPDEGEHRTRCESK